jgi:hypothetical protein
LYFKLFLYKADSLTYYTFYIFPFSITCFHLEGYFWYPDDLSKIT